MRRMLVVAVMALFLVAGCGSQGVRAADGSHDSTASPSATPTSDQSTSPSPSPSRSSVPELHGVVSKMRTCELLFYGHSPLISRSLRMAMTSQHGSHSDVGKVQDTTKALATVAAHTHKAWRADLKRLAETLPGAIRPGHSKKEYQQFRAAHRKVVSHCNAYID